tara:strand:+ start:1325 stop:2617 length:1293 start_codon:yes stop_codon:yes gene_type:complete
MSLKIKNFKIDVSNLPVSETRRAFTITGNPGAMFTLFINNEDSPKKYYNFDTETFTTTYKRLERVEIPSSGVISGSIVFPTVTDSDHYDIFLIAEKGTEHMPYNKVLKEDDTIDYALTTGAPSSMMKKVIYQYTNTRITFAVAAKATSGQYATMPTSLHIDGLRSSTTPLKKDIDWTVTAQPAVAETYALSVTRQPLDTDFEVMQTVTINGSASSSTTVVVDDLGGLIIGMKLDKIHNTYETSSIATITNINSSTKTITLDTAKNYTDGQNLIFVGQGPNDIANFTEQKSTSTQIYIAGALIRFEDLKVKTTDFTSTVNGATSSSTSITMDSVVGIRGGGSSEASLMEEDGVEVRGIGFDNTTRQYVETVNNSTKVITVTSAQSLADNTILTFVNCANTARITGKITVLRMPVNDVTITLDLENIVLSST